MFSDHMAVADAGLRTHLAEVVRFRDRHHTRIQAMRLVQVLEPDNWAAIADIAKLPVVDMAAEPLQAVFEQITR